MLAFADLGEHFCYIVRLDPSQLGNLESSQIILLMLPYNRLHLSMHLLIDHLILFPQRLQQIFLSIKLAGLGLVLVQLAHHEGVDEGVEGDPTAHGHNGEEELFRGAGDDVPVPGSGEGGINEVEGGDVLVKGGFCVEGVPYEPVVRT